MEKHTYFNIWYLIMAILGVFWLREIWVAARQAEPIAYKAHRGAIPNSPCAYPPLLRAEVSFRRARNITSHGLEVATQLLFQRENVVDHPLRVGVGYFGMRRHVPRPAAMGAFSDRGGENRDRLRVAPIPGGDVDVRRARFGFIVRVADIALVLLQQDLRRLGLGNTD